MKIKDILTESSVENLPFEEFKHLLSTDYSEAYEQAKKGNIIYRGFGSMQISFNRLQPMRGRKSVNTNNFYTLIMNNDPRFSEFPKRSVIASSNRNTAMSYSADDTNLAVIFPRNGSKIAVCNVPDIWRATPEEVKHSDFTFYQIGRKIEWLYDAMGITVNSYEGMINAQRNYKELQEENSDKYIKIISTFGSILERYNLDSDTIEYIIETGPKALYGLINTSPFTLFNVSNMKLSDNNEVWFDNEFLAISVKFLDTILGD